MVEFATSRLLDEPLKAAIAEMERNAAEGRRAASRRVIGEEVEPQTLPDDEDDGAGGFSKGVAPRPLLREGD